MIQRLINMIVMMKIVVDTGLARNSDKDRNPMWEVVMYT
jgi:hypothetical protein